MGDWDKNRCCNAFHSPDLPRPPALLWIFTTRSLSVGGSCRSGQRLLMLHSRSHGSKPWGGKFLRKLSFDRLHFLVPGGEGLQNTSMLDAKDFGCLELELA